MESCVQFLELLDPSTDQFLFCCYHETNKLKKAFTYKGTIDNYYDILKKHNEQGYGIYVTINSQEGKNRTKNDMLYPRAIFQDDDKGFDGDYPVPPNIVVNTSKNKYQRYWLINNDAPWDKSLWPEYEAIEKRLVKEYGNDKSTTDCSRVLRLPGFKNTKQPNEPYNITCEITHTIYYSYEQLKEVFPPLFEEENVVVDKKLVENTEHKLLSALDSVLSGENFNDALGTLSMHLIDKRYPRDFIIATLQGYMLQSQEKNTDRWQQRYDHLPKQVDAGIKKKASETTVFKKNRIIGKSSSEIHTNLPMPPGFLGELAEDILKTMRYPEPNIAILGAIHIVSTFAGRVFQFEKMGLSYKRILLAPPGRGKNTISTYLQEVISAFITPNNGKCPQVINANMFSTSGDISSTSAIHEALCSFGSRSFILAEAGQAAKNGNDYKKALKGYVLQLVMQPQTASIQPEIQRHKPMEPLFERAGVFLSESIPENYLEALQADQSMIDGDFARTDIIFAQRERTSKNKESANHIIPRRILLNLSRLARLNTQYPEGHKNLPPTNIIRLSADDDVIDFFDTEEDKSIQIINNTQSMMLSTVENRKPLRMKITAAIAAIADKSQEDTDFKDTSIHISHAEWARDYLEAMNTTIMAHADSGAFGDKFETVYKEFETKIVQVLYNFSKRDIHVDNLLAELQIIPRSELSKYLARMPSFDSIKKHYGGQTSRAFDAVLNELEDRGIVQTLSQEVKLQYCNKYPILQTRGLSGKYIIYLYDYKSVKAE